ncbi:MAG: hypothetical protein IJY97_00035 [Clostridia bacterium]|nr:hypothetical protein [Clostridia bacterium]
MKKLVLLIMSLIVLFYSVSCKDNGTLIGDGGESSTDEYVDNYLYTMIGSTLYRISPYSASVVPVCPDPLCFHNDSGCPFFNVDESSIETVGKYIYYLKDGSGWGEYMERLCRFDRESGVFEVVYEPEEGTLRDMALNGSELYFNIAYLDQKMRNTYDLCRFDLSSGAIETLTEEPSNSPQLFMSEKDGRFYWRSNNDFVYYSTDRDYKNRIDGDRTDKIEKVSGDYYYRLEPVHNTAYTRCFKLTAVNAVGGEEIVISEELAGVPVIYGGKIVYSKNGEARYLGLVFYDDSDEPKEYYDQSGGKYYICDPDGSNERLLCDLDGMGCEIMWHSTMIIRDGVGDWIAVEAYHYTEPDENGIIERDDNVYLLINIVSGEVKVAEVEKRN